MSTCMPSPGPMWATWLKLVGLEIILDLSSGSLSISLGRKAVWGSGPRGAPGLSPAAPGTAPSPALLQPLLLRHLEDEPPLAPGPQHLLPAVVRGVGHIEHGSCRREGDRGHGGPQAAAGRGGRTGGQDGGRTEGQDGGAGRGQDGGARRGGRMGAGRGQDRGPARSVEGGSLTRELALEVDEAGGLTVEQVEGALRVQRSYLLETRGLAAGAQQGGAAHAFPAALGPTLRRPMVCTHSMVHTSKTSTPYSLYTVTCEGLQPGADRAEQ